MSKPWKPGRKVVELHPAVRPSRIRRDPVRAAKPDKKMQWRTREWEMWTAGIGIVLFAIAFSVLSIGVSAITGP